MANRAYTDPRAWWNFTGMAVRTGQRLGLHRDLQIAGLTPFEVEMRRRIWCKSKSTAATGPKVASSHLPWLPGESDFADDLHSRPNCAVGRHGRATSWHDGLYAYADVRCRQADHCQRHRLAS